jgi:hypothetical protein
MPALEPTGIIADTLMIRIACIRMQIEPSSVALTMPPDPRLASA